MISKKLATWLACDGVNCIEVIVTAIIIRLHSEVMVIKYNHPEVILRMVNRIKSICGRVGSRHQPMALKVSYTVMIAPPFKTGQPCAILRASSIELALMTEYPLGIAPIEPS